MTTSSNTVATPQVIIRIDLDDTLQIIQLVDKLRWDNVYKSMRGLFEDEEKRKGKKGYTMNTIRFRSGDHVLVMDYGCLFDENSIRVLDTDSAITSFKSLFGGDMVFGAIDFVSRMERYLQGDDDESEEDESDEGEEDGEDEDEEEAEGNESEEEEELPRGRGRTRNP